MKYKVNDLIMASTGQGLYLYQVTSCNPENYIVIGVESDDPSFNHGTEAIVPVSHMDTASHISLAFDKIDTWVLSYTDSMLDGSPKTTARINTHKCHCDKFQVLHFGCKCGGC